MTSDEALAWVDQLNDHMDCGCYDTLTILAAEVRRLRDELQRRINGPDGTDWNGVATLEHERLVAARAEAARLLELVVRASRIVLPQVGRGTCWCEMGIGNPMMTTHAPGCQLAQKWNEDAKAALEDR